MSRDRHGSTSIGGIDRATVQLARKHDLALGDVAGEVGDRVRDVVVGHRQDRQLRDRALAALDAAGTLVDGREVGVHVAGIAAATRDLFARGRDLAQRLAVVRHVREDDEHLHVLLEREVLGDGQRAARREQPLDRGVVGEVQEEDDSLERAGLLELLHEEARLAVRDAHRAEDDGELLAGLDPRLADDLSGELVGRKARAREDRQLLAAHERVQPVDRADAGLDEVGGLLARVRVDRRAGDVEALLGDDRRPAVDRLAGAVRARGPAARGATSILATSSRKRTSVSATSMPRVPSKTWMTAVVARDLEHLAGAARAVGHRDRDHLVVRHTVDVVDEDERARDVEQRPVVGGDAACAGGSR